MNPPDEYEAAKNVMQFTFLNGMICAWAMMPAQDQNAESVKRIAMECIQESVRDWVDNYSSHTQEMKKKIKDAGLS